MIPLFEHSRAPSVAEADHALAELNALRQQDETLSLSKFWASRGGSLSVLATLVKADLRRRFAEGEKISVAEYLEKFPELRDESERVVSLVYEEYCLLEERGEAPDPDQFCDRYDPWKDSLASQLRYHRLLSQVAGGTPTPAKYPEPGDYFLQFRLRSILGQGGAARVYLANDEDLGGRHRALKVSQDRGDEPSIMGRLDHRYIVPVLSVNRDPESGLRGLCMPYRPGRPLDAVLRRMESTPLTARTAQTLWDAASPELLETVSKDDHKKESEVDGGWANFPHRGNYPDAVAWVAAALAEALAHSHSRGILHRDVKPANVLLTAADGPQLLDFNLAHDPHSADHAEAALRGGTLPYMAPEQLRAFLNADHWEVVGPAADLYALGLLLRELLTGQRPEAPGPEIPLPRAIQELLDRRLEPPGTVRKQNPKVPHALDAIVRKALAVAPRDRYPDADTLAEDLQRYLHRRPLRFAGNPSPLERTRNWTWRHRKLLRASTGALAFITLLTYAFLWLRAPDAQAYAQQGLEYLENGQLIEAHDAFAHALLLDPQQDQARDGMRNLHRDFYQHALVELNRENPQGFFEFMQWAERLGYQPTIDDANKFVKAAKLLSNGDKDLITAYSLYNRVIDLDPKHYLAYQALALRAHREKHYPDFRERMSQAILHAKKPPWDLDGTVKMANLFQQRAAASVSLDDFQEAIDDLRTAETHLIASGDLKAADKEINDEAQLTLFRIHYTFGKAYIARMNQSILKEEKALILENQELAKNHLLAASAMDLEQSEEAKKLLNQVLEVGRQAHEESLASN